MKLIADKVRVSRTGIVVSIIAITATWAQTGQAQANTGGVYGGVFAGVGSSSNDAVKQMGMAHRPVGPLYVNAAGDPESTSARIGGIHVGYEWAVDWAIKPAVELEGFYLGNTQRGQLVNPTPEIDDHRFRDTFPMDMGVLLINSVWSHSFAQGRITPYAGIGAGTAVISISGADSTQLNPAEPGINHFNSNPDATASTLAVQAKLGLRGRLTDTLDWFAEYRHLRLRSTNYTFGSTVYDSHVPTSPWNVNLGDMEYNLGTVGVRYAF
ncbi:outer membrane protein [Steroidobacter cummioxidans]|uniref:outer membrane protein n=1 Tax=Steroidobacter cummioxidans TaxID=1803913 RepID=UPI000E312963|nr:outer membrane beta-barrel protein [Steroidobacter cummioxidans]